MFMIYSITLDSSIDAINITGSVMIPNHVNGSRNQVALLLESTNRIDGW